MVFEKSCVSTTWKPIVETNGFDSTETSASVEEEEFERISHSGFDCYYCFYCCYCYLTASVDAVHCKKR